MRVYGRDDIEKAGNDDKLCSVISSSDLHGSVAQIQYPSKDIKQSAAEISNEAEHFQHIEPVALRHLDIQKNEVGFLVTNLFECLDTGSGFSDDLDVRVALQQNPDICAGERLVVYD